MHIAADTERLAEQVRALREYRQGCTAEIERLRRRVIDLERALSRLDRAEPLNDRDRAVLASAHVRYAKRRARAR